MAQILKNSSLELPLNFDQEEHPTNLEALRPPSSVVFFRNSNSLLISATRYRLLRFVSFDPSLTFLQLTSAADSEGADYQTFKALLK